ncbi:Autoinducer 2 sensor kinase/phosphatase LuxQ [compost metagenome]
MTSGARGWTWRWWLGWLVLLAMPCRAAAQLPEAVRFTTADGLPSNAVHQVVEDRHGYLWFATEDGLARFDGRHFRVWQREQGLVGNVLTHLALDAEDRLWMGTAQGAVMRMSADRARIESLVGEGGAAVTALLPDAAGGVWFGVRGAGLYRWQPSQRLRHYLPTVRGDGLPEGDVEHLWAAAGGGVWVGSRGGLARWHDGRFHRPADPRLATAAITGLGGGTAGALWVSSSRGRWRIAADADVQAIAAHPRARLLGIGRAQAQWLADAERVWRQPLGDAPALAVRLAEVDRGTRPTLRTVFEDRHGGAWLLGRHLGVWRLPPLWPHFTVQPTPPPRRGLDGVLPSAARPGVALQCGGQHHWRIRGGALETRRGGAAWRSVRWPGGEAAPGAWSVHCGHVPGGVWVGTRQGLLRWDGTRLQAVSGAPPAISAMHVDADGRLWIAADGVLQRYRWRRLARQPELKPELRLDVRDGVPAGQVHGMATDAAGLLWATSAHGLLRVAPHTRQVRVYARDDGIPEEVLQAGLQAQGTQMLAIGEDGVTIAFAPAALAQPASPPALVIDRVQLRRDGQRISVPPLAPVRLHADDRDIQISARVLSPRLDPRQQYRFRLRGGAQRWSYTRSRGTIGFAQLAAGTHVLEYQERGGDGRWSALQALPLQVQRGAWQHPGVQVLRALLGVVGCGVLGWLAWHQWARARQRRAWMQQHASAAQSAQAKARYLATFGHELRTPLTGVLGMSELLLATALAPLQRRRLARIQGAARALLVIIDQTLEAARIEAGRLPLQRVRTELGAVLRDWEQQARAQLDGRGGGLTLHVQLPGHTWVQADPRRLQQLLLAATGALVDALAPCTLAVQVHWLPGRSGILVEMRAAPAVGVAARGRPVPAARLQRLQDDARSQQGQVYQHPRSACGAGLTLSLALPPAAPEASRACPADAANAQRQLRVLLVEDDPLVADVHAGLLAARGAQVVLAAHALAALAELASAAVDVVLLDLDLPGVDGWQLLQMLESQGCTVPVVVLTARNDADLAGRVTAAGAVALLHKPTTGEALLAAVRAARGR